MSDSRFLSSHLGTLYKKHGMSISYVSGYIDNYTPCNYVCAVHGDFSNVPVNTTSGSKKRNGCPSCSSVNRRTSARNALLYGVGLNDWEGSVTIGYAKKIPEYQMWKDLLKRVYSEKYHAKSNTYIGVTIDPRWHSLKAFIDDVSKLKNYENALHNGYALDKDIVLNGNRHYSKETCCFVPPEVNIQFTTMNKTNGLPKGVYRTTKGNCFACDCKVDGKTVYLGSYKTQEEAFIVRKVVKQKEMKKLADKYRGVLDERVIHKLDNFDYNESGVIITPDLNKEAR